MQRIICYYSGQVQGVGFRYTAQHIARQFQVSGFVRNLPDGRVELVAEGEPDELDRFTEAIRQNFPEHIRKMQRDTAPATGEFAGFTIRH